mmetsp:Transcript_128052/g.221243  ORF Transcript_128052/g.221243 Transcript_128052/m.221243 type:complete len:113 (-) Transcript_128052:31-369(-)
MECQWISTSPKTDHASSPVTCLALNRHCHDKWMANYLVYGLFTFLTTILFAFFIFFKIIYILRAIDHLIILTVFAVICVAEFTIILISCSMFHGGCVLLCSHLCIVIIRCRF